MNAWAALGMALAMGMIVGMLLSSSGSITLILVIGLGLLIYKYVLKK
jgi:hypothetical protein